MGKPICSRGTQYQRPRQGKRVLFEVVSIGLGRNAQLNRSFRYVHNRESPNRHWWRNNETSPSTLRASLTNSSAENLLRISDGGDP